MSEVVLHDYWRSSAAYRVRIALNLKNVDYRQRSVHLGEGEQRSAAYRASNPMGLIPLLEIDGLRLTQSLSIMVYLDQTRPEPLLMPRDPAEGAHCRAMALTIACDIHPLDNLRVLNYLSNDLKIANDAKADWYDHWIREGLTALEAIAAPRAGRFLFGDQPSVADICLVPQLYNARTRSRVDLDAYPTLLRAESNAQSIEAFARAHPDRNKEPQ